jgi:AraC-like DNA-binding protein
MPHIVKPQKAAAKLQNSVHRAHGINGVIVMESAFENHRFDRHWHDMMNVGVIEKGVNKFWCRGSTLYASENEIIAMNPGEVHDGRNPDTLDGWKQKMFMIAPETMAQVQRDVTGHALGDFYLKAEVLDDPALVQAVRIAHQVQTWAQHDPHTYGLQAESALMAMLVAVTLRMGDSRPTAAEVHRHLQAVHTMEQALLDDLTQTPTLDTLAQLAGLSRYQALRCFAAVKGMPPHAYVRQYRTHKAAKMLEQGATIAAAAAETGFSDQAHMTRLFKRTFGVTPRVYRTVF